MVAGSAFTGAAVLRVTGRVFLGLGKVPGEEERSPSDDEQEKADRPLWLMMLPTSLLLLLALCAAHAAGDYAARIVLPFMHPQAEAILGLAPMQARHPAGCRKRRPHGCRGSRSRSPWRSPPMS